MGIAPSRLKSDQDAVCATDFDLQVSSKHATRETPICYRANTQAP